jgi:hypothetical protein
VPLSVEWFNSTPELQKFFKTTWINSGYDIRILSGGSGEGVCYYPNQNESSNESFIQMNSLLEKTAEFIKKTAKDEKTRNSPEARWLEAMQKRGKSSIERMIFFSPETWYILYFPLGVNKDHCAFSAKTIVFEELDNKK